MRKVSAYIKYRTRAVTQYGLHSPFMYELYNQVFKPRWNPTELNEPNELRSKLLRDKRTITVTDLGAGSKKIKSPQRSIKSIASTSVKKKKYARLISRLIKHFNSGIIIELGTSLGITTVYLSRSTQGAVFTIEGCPSIHSVAVQNLKDAGCKNVTALQGSFNQVLPELLNSQPRFDMAFMDGWHTYEGTLFQFNELIKKAGEESILIIDDIHWSADMEKAWNEITQHPKVTATIDIFEMGIVFLDTNLSRETFYLKY